MSDGLEISLISGALTLKTTRLSGECQNRVMKSIPMSSKYMGENEADGRQNFLDHVKKDVERESRLNCSEDTCKGLKRCMFDYEIGEIRVTTLVKPGGKTEKFKETVSDGCWLFEAEVLCGCWCHAPD